MSVVGDNVPFWQWLLDVRPALRTDAEKIFGGGCDCRQHRFEQGSQYPEIIQTFRANFQRAAAGALVAGEIPGFGEIEGGIGLLRKRHDVACRLAELPARIVFADGEGGLCKRNAMAPVKRLRLDEAITRLSDKA